MARFRFPLQSILDIKMKMETQAKQEFSLAMNELDTEEQKLSELRNRREHYQDEIRKLLQGTLKFREIEDNKNAILYLDEVIEKQQVVVAKARMKVEAARAKMTEAVKDRKTYEILREQAFEEFMREENAAESKAVDELVSYTYGQRIQSDNH